VSKKRPIDIQRDAAISLRIGGDDNSAIKELLSTSKNLYVIKENGIFKIQLADDIDPARTNPNIPTHNQQVLTARYNNEIVARILLTAKYLFDEKNATVDPFVAELFESCLILTKQILELSEMTGKLSEEINEKEQNFLQNPPKPNAFILPSIHGIDTKIYNILSKADKSKDTLLEIHRLHFLPETRGKVVLDELDNAISLLSNIDPNFISEWKKSYELFMRLRHLRNASEHPDENKVIIANDFTMKADGKISLPTVEIRHPKIPNETLSVLAFLEFLRKTLLDYAENTVVFIKRAALLNRNPFNERVVEFPEEERRHKFVRYYRAINIGGNWRILG
jgi:hypothetical protein